MDELTFVKTLTTDQPFVPKYFPVDVEINKKGAGSFHDGIDGVLRISNNFPLEKNTTMIDTRHAPAFRNGHIKGAINLQDGDHFETWLGAIINPDEQFYLIAANDEDLDTVIEKIAKIGYEQHIKAALLPPATMTIKSSEMDLNDFKSSPEKYTIVDVRNHGETEEGLVFGHALTVPLPELRERVSEIPTDKPIVVHCAAGYRSAAAVSIISAKITTVPVYDLGEAVIEIGNLKSEV